MLLRFADDNLLLQNQTAYMNEPIVRPSSLLPASIFFIIRTNSLVRNFDNRHDAFLTGIHENFCFFDGLARANTDSRLFRIQALLPIFTVHAYRNSRVLPDPVHPWSFLGPYR